jgi:hypothetical protein
MSRIEDQGWVAGPSWLGAVVRAFHPVRWGLCGVGLAASVLLCTAAQAVFFEQAAPRPQAWWPDPLAELRRLGAELLEQGSGTAVCRCFPLAAALSVVWSLVGAWIARSELLRQRAAAAADQTDGLPPTTATALVRSKASALVMLLPSIFILVGIWLLPGWLAGLLIRFLGMGIGALLVAILLPVVLLTSLVVVVVLVGCISWCLMPAVIAAEGSDSWEGVSRGYSYLYQRPVLFGAWWGLALAISGLPLLGGFLLLRQEPNLLDPAEKSAVGAAAAALSVSLFWTLQSLVYLKMRRAVDKTSENEIWVSGPKPEPSAVPADTPLGRAVQPEPLEASTPESGAGPARTNPEKGSPEEETAPELVRPQRTEVSFWDTSRSRMDAQSTRLLALLIGVSWTALVLAGGALATWGLAAGPGQEMTAANLREAIRTLAEQRPGILFGIAVGVVLLGALGLGRWLKIAARMAAVHAVYGGGMTLKPVWPFASRTRGLGVGSVLLAAAGIELLLVAGFLAPPAFQGSDSWEEAATLGGLGVGLLGLGALGLGAVAVEGQRREGARLGAAGIYLGNGLETGASAVANLVLVPLRSVTVLGLAWLVWLLACESLSWSGGEKVQWVRWGQASSLVPESEGGLYRAAAAIAGIWFLLFSGLFLMYPLSCVLTWGITCYLRARQQTEGIPPGQLELSAAERQRLISGKQFLEDMRKKVQDRALETNEGGARAGNRQGPRSRGRRKGRGPAGRRCAAGENPLSEVSSLERRIRQVL